MLRQFMMTMALFGSAYATDASANRQEDGNELLAECNVVLRALDDGQTRLEDASDGGACLGYMEAFANLSRVYQIKDRSSALFCIPKDGISNGQAARIVVKYLRANPEELHRPKIFAAIAAFRDAFPCE